MALHLRRSSAVDSRVPMRTEMRHSPTEVLALVTSTVPWSPAATVAFALARLWDSHVTGCFVDPALRTLRGRDAEPTVLSLLLEPPGNMEVEATAFDALGRRCGVTRSTWLSARSGLARTMHQLGTWHDLIVLERDIGGEDGGFELLGEALLGCRTPCLMLPPRCDGGAPAFDRVILAWNGSLEAARAIHASLPFLMLAREVVLVDGTAKVPGDDEAMPFFHPMDHLASQGITAMCRRIHVPSHGAGDALLHEARRMNADLLVMGAYGKSLLRERILGGATRRILGQATLPVLMRH